MSDGEDEDARERYRELLEELRTIIPGAQVLFAFLLAAPFAARFAGVDRVGVAAFTLSLMAVAAATVLFLAPAAYHRFADRRDRLARLRYGVRMTVAGLALLAVAVASAVFVVVRFLFDSDALGVAAAAGVTALALALWLVLPERDRRKSGGPREADQ